MKWRLRLIQHELIMLCVLAIVPISGSRFFDNFISGAAGKRQNVMRYFKCPLWAEINTLVWLGKMFGDFSGTFLSHREWGICVYVV